MVLFRKIRWEFRCHSYVCFSVNNVFPLWLLLRFSNFHSFPAIYNVLQCDFLYAYFANVWLTIFDLSLFFSEIWNTFDSYFFKYLSCPCTLSSPGTPLICILFCFTWWNVPPSLIHFLFFLVLPLGLFVLLCNQVQWYFIFYFLICHLSHIMYYFLNVIFYWLCYHSCPVFSPFAPLHPAPPPPSSNPPTIAHVHGSCV